MVDPLQRPKTQIQAQIKTMILDCNFFSLFDFFIVFHIFSGIGKRTRTQKKKNGEIANLR